MRINALFLSMIAGAVLTTVETTNANECDFSQQTGVCRATINILSTGGSKPSYSAEIKVSSSAPTCSKVEYYLHNTLNTTVLKSSNTEHESLFGTEPIKKKSIKVSKCTQFAATGNAKYNKGDYTNRMSQCIRNFKAALKAGTNNGMGLSQYSDRYCDL